MILLGAYSLLVMILLVLSLVSGPGKRKTGLTGMERVAVFLALVPIVLYIWLTLADLWRR